MIQKKMKDSFHDDLNTMAEELYMEINAQASA